MTDNEYVRNARNNFMNNRRQPVSNTDSINVPSSQGLPNLQAQESKEN
jgi:hypothetical protein